MENLVWRLRNTYANEWHIQTQNRWGHLFFIQAANKWNNLIHDKEVWTNKLELERLTDATQWLYFETDGCTAYWGNNRQRWLLLFSITAIQRDSQVLLFLIYSFVWTLVETAWKQSEESNRKSKLTHLAADKKTLHMMSLSSSLSMTTLFLLSSSLLPLSLFSLSLCEVWSSCCFPCRD